MANYGRSRQYRPRGNKFDLAGLPRLMTTPGGDPLSFRASVLGESTIGRIQGCGAADVPGIDRDKAIAAARSRGAVKAGDTRRRGKFPWVGEWDFHPEAIRTVKLGNGYSEYVSAPEWRGESRRVFR